MARVDQIEPKHWLIYTGAEEDADVFFEVRMSSDEAERIMSAEVAHLKSYNPDLNPNATHPSIVESHGEGVLYALTAPLARRPSQPVVSRWDVPISSREETAEPQVLFEVRMSEKTVEKIAQQENDRIAVLNPGRTDIKPLDTGTALSHILRTIVAKAR